MSGTRAAQDRETESPKHTGETSCRIVKLPWPEGLNYAGVKTFMRYAIPILSELLEEIRLNKLIAPNNVRKATLRII